MAHGTASASNARKCQETSEGGALRVDGAHTAKGH